MKLQLNHTVLVIGATGYIGSHLCEYLVGYNFHSHWNANSVLIFLIKYVKGENY